MRDWPQATGGEPLIRQLSIPAQPSELDDIGGRNIKQITICTVAGKWGLDMGGLPFGDCLPQRAAVAPEEFPARFASMAGTAFKQLAGLRYRGADGRPSNWAGALAVILLMAVWKLWNSPRRKTLAVLPFLLALLYLERLEDGDG